MHLDCRRNQFRYFGTKRTQQECTSNVVEIFRLPLECGSNTVGTSRLACKNASLLPLESICDIFGCSSNAARMQLERPDQDARMSRMHLECISIAVGIFRLPFEMRLECSWNVPTRMQECPECTSNASRMPSESFDCRSNAARMQLERPD